MNNTFKVILLVCLAIIVWFAIVYFLALFTQKRRPSDTIRCYVGAPGTGKTKVGVQDALFELFKAKWRWRLHLIPHKAKKDIFTKEGILLYKKGDAFIRPSLYSSIPVIVGWKRLGFKKFEPIYSNVLTWKHLTLQERIPEYSVIFVDEIGQIADQYSYDNPVVMQYLQEFFRFCRHYLDPRIICTDQVSSNVSKPIRTRIGTIYSLSNFRRYWLFWYKVDVEVLRLTDDIVNIQQVDNTEPIPFFFGMLPFKYLKFLNFSRRRKYPVYDSRCYSVNYSALFTGLPMVWQDSKTSYFIELPPVTNSLKKEFANNGFIPVDKMNELMTNYQKLKGSSDGETKK